MGYAMPQPPSAFPFQVPFGTQNSGTRKIRRHGELATYLSGEVIKEPPVPYVSLEQVAVRSPPLPPVIRGSPLIRRDEWIHALGPARPGFSGPAIISGFARRLSLVKTIEGHTYGIFPRLYIIHNAFSAFFWSRSPNIFVRIPPPAEPITQEEIILFFKSAPDGIVSAQYLFQNFPGQDRLASQESYMKFHEMFLKVSEFNEGIGAYRLKENNGLNQSSLQFCPFLDS